MRIINSLALLMLGVHISHSAEVPPSATVTNWQKGTHSITASIRTNGCTLELLQITNSRNPELTGYWIQHVYAGGKHILQIEHSAVHKEQSLAIDPCTGYAVGQVDRNLGGKYDMLVVVSVTNQALTEVLFVTEMGWLRHSTPDEFQARQRIGQQNREDMEAAQKAFQKAGEDLPKIR